jgi:Protein of unknown function (DUF1579)
MITNKTWLFVTCCIGLTSLALAQSQPAAPSAAAKGPEHATAKPGEQHPMMGKPGEQHPMMGKPGEHGPMAKPGEHEHMGKPEAGPGVQGAPDMPKPPPELEAAFKPLDGMWKCDSKFPAGALGPNSPETTAKTMVRFHKIERGFFYQGDYDMKKTKTTPGMKGSMLISYQPEAKTFVMTSHDDMGGAGLATSPGFSGDSIAFTGDAYMMGQKVKVRDTMTKGDKTLSHKMEVDMGKGFQLMGEDSCKR